MLVEPNTRRQASAHVVVVGNEKGGSGKSTTAMHVAVALLKAGQRVAPSISIPGRRASPITSKIGATGRSAPASSSKCRRISASRAATTLKLDENEAIEFAGFAEAIDRGRADPRFRRGRYARHRQLSDAARALDGRHADHAAQRQLRRLRRARHRRRRNYAVTGESHYSEMVRDARRQRRMVDGSRIDWIVVRNRLSTLGSRNKRLVGRACTSSAPGSVSRRRRLRRAGDLSRILSARADGARQARRGNARHAARACRMSRPATEVHGLIEALRLPLDERGQRRAAARAEWFAAHGQAARDCTMSWIGGLGRVRPPLRARGHCAVRPSWPL